MRSSMLILGAVNVVNILVASTLTFGLGPIAPWGIDGIVAGTVTARIFGGLLMLFILSRGVTSSWLLACPDVWRLSGSLPGTVVSRFLSDGRLRPFANTRTAAAASIARPPMASAQPPYTMVRSMPRRTTNRAASSVPAP